MPLVQGSARPEHCKTAQCQWTDAHAPSCSKVSHFPLSLSFSIRECTRFKSSEGRALFSFLGSWGGEDYNSEQYESRVEYNTATFEFSWIHFAALLLLIILSNHLSSPQSWRSVARGSASQLTSETNTNTNFTNTNTNLASETNTNLC